MSHSKLIERHFLSNFFFFFFYICIKIYHHPPLSIAFCTDINVCAIHMNYLKSLQCFCIKFNRHLVLNIAFCTDINIYARHMNHLKSPQGPLYEIHQVKWFSGKHTWNMGKTKLTATPPCITGSGGYVTHSK